MLTSFSKTLFVSVYSFERLKSYINSFLEKLKTLVTVFEDLFANKSLI